MDQNNRQQCEISVNSDGQLVVKLVSGEDELEKFVFKREASREVAEEILEKQSDLYRPRR